MCISFKLAHFQYLFFNKLHFLYKAYLEIFQFYSLTPTHKHSATHIHFQSMFLSLPNPSKLTLGEVCVHDSCDTFYSCFLNTGFKINDDRMVIAKRKEQNLSCFSSVVLFIHLEILFIFKTFNLWKHLKSPRLDSKGKKKRIALFGIYQEIRFV